MNREQAIEKAKKLKALAERGIGGEKVNAKAQMERIMSEHGISDLDLEFETHDIGHGLGTIQVAAKRYSKGDIVIAGYLKYRMIVVDAVLYRKGWKYTCRFIKKNGTADMRTSARCYFANDITKCEQKALLPSGVIIQ